MFQSSARGKRVGNESRAHCYPPMRWGIEAAALGLTVSLALGQNPSSSGPSTPVAIENSNAAFTPTDVDVPQANPARPTVTIPAHIPPTGYLQFEQGFVHADSSPAGTVSQTALSQTTKIALTTRLLVQFISEPYARSIVATSGSSSVSSNDPGDLDLGFQVVAYKSIGALPTASVGYIRRVRSDTSANLDLGD